MRVAIFTDTYIPDINGVALTLDRWVTYLKQHHHEVIVFAPEGEERLSDEEQIKRYKSFPFVLYPELQAAFPNPIDIDKQVVQFQPDIIHVATPFNLGLFGRRYALKHNIPFTETFGNVILEALSSGLPVIGANAGGVKELVVSAHNGILCPANHIDSFVEALIFLLSNPSVRKYYGQNARNAAMKFNWNHIFNDFAFSLETIIKVNKQTKLNTI